ncbi:rRNA maturation RNase YbeY [Macrococcus carouselicus]|uniref:Endoribonuclease YbeY n=1 Tax=Macrococcus carouselicus TaxID=69969 RepID=A0A9Q8CPJ7_9STAP|nr:rRNA maturation RNase YbeY [Macrococcus carouselicus]TDM04377.1 rRNA maturation RNase YbeY [Macrococcus carouselicus]
MLTVEFIDDSQTVDAAYLPEVEALLQFAAEEEGIVDEAEVAVSFVTAEEIRAINHQYRDKDSVTDVISFALEEGEDDFQDPSEVRVLGDIIICIERAQEQAAEYGHSFERELGFLALHGLLHLLGYDHLTAEEEKVMFGRQDQILSAYGLTREG